MKHLMLGLLSFIFLAGILCAEDDPEVLLRDGREAFCQSETDPNAIVTAARKFTAALEIYEQRKDDLACTKINSFLFWCRRRMSDKNINDFLRDPKNAPVATRLEGTKKTLPATDAKIYFDRAEKFASDNPNDSLSIAALYFEVAERFVGTPMSLEAQRKSLDFQQRAFKAMGEKPNKATPPKEIAVVPGHRLPMPDAKAQKEAEKIIKEVFKEDYAKLAKAKPEEKSLFAQKLLKQATESKDDKTAQYVLWREANTVVAQNGEIDLALSIADQIGQVFEIDAIELRKKTVQTAQRGVQDGEALKAMNAMLILEDKPNDGEANLIVGKYYCFQRQDWKKGVPLLGKGSDAALKTLALLDLGENPEAPGQASIGDGWWDLAEKETAKVSKIAIQERARFWYEKALTSLTGLTKAKVEKRLASNPRIINLLSLAGTPHDKNGRIEWKNGELVLSNVGGSSGISFSYQPPEEYDIKMVFVRTEELPNQDHDTKVILPFPSKGKYYQYMFRQLAKPGGTFSYGFSGDASTWITTPLTIIKGRTYTKLFQIRKDGINVYLDGKQIYALNEFSKISDRPERSELFVGSWNNLTIVHSLEVIEITGRGKITVPIVPMDELPKLEGSTIPVKPDSKELLPKPFITLTDKATWISTVPFDIGVRWDQNRSYHVTKFPEEMKGGTFLLHDAKHREHWLLPDQLIVSKDCILYVAIMWKYKESIHVTPEQFDIMTKSGWATVGEDFTTSVANRESWKWKVIKKQIRAGPVNVEDSAKMNGGNAAVMFILK